MNHQTPLFPRRLLLWLAPFLLLAGLSGCADSFSVAKVEDPAKSALRDEQACRLVLVGQVLDGRTLAPVANAGLRILDDGASSDADGHYRMEVADVLDPLAGERLLYVVRPGYELSTFRFDPAAWLDADHCEGTTTYITLDLVLTPRKAPVTLQPNAETNWIQRDTFLFRRDTPEEGLRIDTFIQVLEVQVPAGSVDQPTPVQFVAYHPASYLGDLGPAGPWHLPLLRFRLASQSMADLNKPFTVRFKNTHPVPYVAGDGLAAQRLHDKERPFVGFHLPANRWQAADAAQVLFLSEEEQIVVRSTRLGSYLIQNTAQPLTRQELVQEGPRESLVNLNNCQCGAPLPLAFTVPVDGSFQHAAGGPLDALVRLRWLNDLKVLTNTPFGSLLHLGLDPQSGRFQSFYPEPVRLYEEQSMLGKCRQLYITAQPLGQQLSGQQYGSTYQLQRVLGLRVSYNALTCPTSSPCHQGCP